MFFSSSKQTKIQMSFAQNSFHRLYFFSQQIIEAKEDLRSKGMKIDWIIMDEVQIRELDIWKIATWCKSKSLRCKNEKKNFGARSKLYNSNLWFPNGIIVARAKVNIVFYESLVLFLRTRVTWLRYGKIPDHRCRDLVNIPWKDWVTPKIPWNRH